MNSYYHAFVPGFNWWYVFSVLFMVAMAFIGAAMYRMNDNLKIRRRYNEKIFTVSSVFFAVVISIMVFWESSQGIVQYFDNRLGLYESPACSRISASIMIVIATMLYMTVLYAVGMVASWAKHGYLVEKCAEMRKQEQKENPRA